MQNDGAARGQGRSVVCGESKPIRVPLFTGRPLLLRRRGRNRWQPGCADHFAPWVFERGLDVGLAWRDGLLARGGDMLNFGPRFSSHQAPIAESPVRLSSLVLGRVVNLGHLPGLGLSRAPFLLCRMSPLTL